MIHFREAGAPRALVLAALLACAGCAREEPETGWAEATFPRLSPRARAAQLVVASPGRTPPERVRAWVREDSVGGVRLEGGRALAVARSLAALRAAAPLPLLVAAELDGGAGALVPEATELPPPRVLAALGDAELTGEAGALAAREARALGVHLALVRLPEAETEPAAALPRSAAGAAADGMDAYLAALRGGGLLAGVRLLPPGSGVARDSVATLRWDRARLEATELSPVRRALAGGVEAAVLPDLALPAVTGDSVPLSLSRAGNVGMLRRDLGFGGLVVADVGPGGALARRHGEAEAAVLALAAGADLLVGVSDPRRTVAALLAAVRDGRLRQARIDEAARRVLELKGRLRARAGKEMAPDSVARLLGTREARALARRAAERALVLLGPPPGPLLRTCRAPLLVARPGEAPLLERELARRFPLMRLLPVPAAAPADSLPPRLGERMRQADCLVLLEREPRPGPGLADLARRAALPDTAGLADTAKARLRAAAAARRTVAVRLLGSGAAALPGAGTVVLARGRGEEAQRAAVRALAGELPAPAAPEGLRWPPTPTLRAAQAAEVGMSEAALARADEAIRAAVRDGVFPGAALAVGRRGGLVRLRGYGRPGSPAAGTVDPEETLYDVASLTKVAGTTAAVMALVEDGRLRLETPVRRHVPGFTGRWKERVTIRHLLTHTSGLPAGDWLYGKARSPEGALRKTLETPLLRPPGERMEYSDFGFILLAEAAERAAGEPLDRYLARRVYGPLGMSSTMYLPPRVFRAQTAPASTESPQGYALWGTVHDANAFRLGGMAGHAGLFSTARDLAVLSQALLNGGAYGTQRVLSPGTVRSFSQHRARVGRRALGWDTPAQRSSAGSYFSPRSYGHTGFTGTSVWIDPDRALFVVLLTNRTHDKASQRAMLEVRERVHDAVARAITDLPMTPRPGSPVAVEEARRARIEAARKAKLERDRRAKLQRERARQKAKNRPRPKGRRRG